MSRKLLPCALVFLAALGLAACGGKGSDAPAGPTEEAGKLVAGDDTLQSGEFVDAYDVLAREGQWIRAQILSGDFDPYIIVMSPTGEQTDVDDSQEKNLSMAKAVVEATEAGKWQILVTSFEPGESGDYTLSYELLDARPADADEGRQVEYDSTETDDA